MNLVGTSIIVWVIGDFAGTLSCPDCRKGLDSHKVKIG
jgi:hypothetical protein